MAGSFYSLQEAAAKLGVSEDEVKSMVRAGKLREFRDGGKINFKVEEVNRLANPDEASMEDLLLEPAEGSSIHLAPLDEGDAVRLSETDLEDTAAGQKAQKDKGGSVVPSVGVSVFDDEEIDKNADPMAETVMAADDPLGLEGTGSGSGLLDLTRESDDTSLGAELLDEIFPGDEDSVEMGDATRAGLEEAIVEERTEEVVEFQAPAATAAPRVVRRVEVGPDAMSVGLGAMMAVGLLVMVFVGLGAASIARGVWPSILEAVYRNLWMYGAGALVVSLVALALGYFVGKRTT